MPSINDLYNCKSCSQTVMNRSNECVHCFGVYCMDCLVKHHHTDIKHELEDLIRQIDGILNKFLYHAHNQIDWTDHLTKDQQQLKFFVQFIDTSSKRYTIHNLPKSQWIYHVEQLIKKTEYAIHEDCSNILSPKKVF